MECNCATEAVHRRIAAEVRDGAPATGEFTATRRGIGYILHVARRTRLDRCGGSRERRRVY